jgi:hypothetical protein
MKKMKNIKNAKKIWIFILKYEIYKLSLLLFSGLETGYVAMLET